MVSYLLFTGAGEDSSVPQSGDGRNRRVREGDQRPVCLMGGKLRHSRALLTALLLHSQAGHSCDGATEKSWGRGAAARLSWAEHTPLAFTARGEKIHWVQLNLEGLTRGHPMGAVLVAEPACCTASPVPGAEHRVPLESPGNSARGRTKAA